MKVLLRLAACGVVATTVLSIIMFISTASEALESILYEELTCEELWFSYHFNVEVLDDILVSFDNCLDYVDDKMAGHTHGALGCKFIREHGEFVQGIVNDVAAVFNIKCADE